MKKLFTERHGVMKPRVLESLDEATRNGLLSLVRARIDEEWFGDKFPSSCPDGRGNAGCDTKKLSVMMAAYNIIWPADWIDCDEPPSDGQVFDLIEFSYEHISAPTEGGFHSYWNHSHFTYDEEAGRQRFEDDVNRMFERNGIAFALIQGEIMRVGPLVLDESLAQAVFNTGDKILDDILEIARQKFLHRSLDVRRESLEKLWDAWERLKTIEPGRDKKDRTKALLDKSAKEPNFRQMLEVEAVTLTNIGNNFMIRHTETNRTPIDDSTHVDYLFHRMFAIICLLLNGSGATT